MGHGREGGQGLRPQGHPHRHAARPHLPAPGASPGKRSDRHKDRANATTPCSALAIRDKLSLRPRARRQVSRQPQPAPLPRPRKGKPDESFVYLIGMLVVHRGVEARHSFWAEAKDQEQAVFEQFLAEVYPDTTTSGCSATAVTSGPSCGGCGSTATRQPVDRVLGSLVNVLSLVHSHLYFPSHSNGLKEIGGLLGSTWSEPDASGLQSLVWRARWEATGDDRMEAEARGLQPGGLCSLEKGDRVRGRRDRPPESGTASNLPAPSSRPGRRACPPVVRVQDARRTAGERPGRSWGVVRFVHPDFEHINNCAYFDYQRERVYVRTSKAAEASRTGQAEPGTGSSGSNQRVQITISWTCPSARGRSIRRRPQGRGSSRPRSLA